MPIFYGSETNLSMSFLVRRVMTTTLSRAQAMALNKRILFGKRFVNGKAKLTAGPGETNDRRDRTGAQNCGSSVRLLTNKPIIRGTDNLPRAASGCWEIKQDKLPKLGIRRAYWPGHPWSYGLPVA